MNSGRKIHRTTEGTPGPHHGGYTGKAIYRTQEVCHGPPITAPRRVHHYLDATHLPPYVSAVVLPADDAKRPSERRRHTAMNQWANYPNLRLRPTKAGPWSWPIASARSGARSWGRVGF
jgi:hypothetical protein